jgi:hypothetical protein
MLLNLLMNNEASGENLTLSWGQQLLLLQLLNRYLNVVEVISGSAQGLHQIVSIPLALAAFQGAMSEDHLFYGCLNWGREDSKELEFKEELRKKVMAFEEFLKNYLPYPALDKSNRINPDLAPFFSQQRP